MSLTAPLGDSSETDGLVVLSISDVSIRLIAERSGCGHPSEIAHNPVGSRVPIQDEIRILSGTLAAFERYAGQEHSYWLLDLAHDICDARERRGALLVLNAGDWRQVRPSDPLVASKYLYQLPAGAFVSLSRISIRKGDSLVDSDIEYANTLRERVLLRDASACWISGITYAVLLQTPNVCPKRMGDHLARHTLRAFCTTDDGDDYSNTNVYDTKLAITLSVQHAVQFTRYRIGFRLISPATQTYRVHIFSELPQWYTVVGGYVPGVTLPPVHGTEIRPPQPDHPDNPPCGLFRWHYMQCVVKEFGHPDYKSLPNMVFEEAPMRMDEHYGQIDIDVDVDDEERAEDWPSAGWDRALADRQDEEAEEERLDAVASWVATQEAPS